jgi:hypothetical protein
MVERKSKKIQKLARDKNEQEAYENKLAEYVGRIRNGELSSYRASKLSGKPLFFKFII